jgi:hypothetical protein
MAGINPKFNDWAFTNVGLVITSAELDLNYAARGDKTLVADGGVVPEGTLSTMQIRLSGKIQASTSTQARDYWSTLLQNLRGTGIVKKGRLDLYGDSHYYCQLTGAVPMAPVPSDGVVSVSLTFEADEPYRRLNAITTYSELVSTSDPILILSYGTAITGNAPRIPCVIKPPTLAFAKGDLIRIVNNTIGWRFEHIVSQALTTSDAIIIDGETGEVYEKGVIVGEGNAGVAPYLRGGVTNQITFSGSTLSRLVGTWTVEFWDRFLG